MYNQSQESKCISNHISFRDVSSCFSEAELAEVDLWKFSARKQAIRSLISIDTSQSRVPAEKNKYGVRSLIKIREEIGEILKIIGGVAMSAQGACEYFFSRVFVRPKSTR